MKSQKVTTLCAAALSLLACAQVNAGWKDLASAALSGDTATASAQAVATQAAAQTATTSATAAQTAYADQIKEALSAAQSLPSLADIQAGKATAATFKTAVDKMKAVKVDKTPADFQTAYTETVNSAGSAVTLAEKMPAKATVTTKQGLISALSQAAVSENPTGDLTKSLTETKTAFTQLNTSRQKLTTLGAKYLALSK